MSAKSSRSASGNTKRTKAAAAKPVPVAPRGKREQNKAANRGDILDAARVVFTELGYDAATVRDIIRHTELASGTFYNYFPDKESVFRALLRDSEERRLEWLGKVDRRGGSFETYLRETFGAYFRFVQADRTTFELLQRNSSTIRAFSRDPVFIEERTRMQRGLASAMDAQLLPRVDAEYLASAMVGVSFEVAVLMVERDPVDVDGATEFVTDLFLGFFSRARGERTRNKTKPKARRAAE